MIQDRNFTEKSTEQSVTRWILSLQDGDHLAAQHLWGFLQHRLMMHAKKWGATASAHYDEEDIAQNAFGALCDGLENGRYSEIDSRTDLWKLLAVITVNKARKLAENENRLKRGGGFSKIPDAALVFSSLSCPNPPPQLTMLLEEQCENRLNLLEDDQLKLLVLLKVEGHTNDEIANTLGCTRRSIQRRLSMIREIWADSDGG